MCVGSRPHSQGVFFLFFFLLWSVASARVGVCSGVLVRVLMVCLWSVWVSLWFGGFFFLPAFQPNRHHGNCFHVDAAKDNRARETGENNEKAKQQQKKMSTSVIVVQPFTLHTPKEPQSRKVLTLNSVVRLCKHTRCLNKSDVYVTALFQIRDVKSLAAHESDADSLQDLFNLKLPVLNQCSSCRLT